jgi:DNA-binding LacI/PurR family transcriptional regulator
MTMSRSAKIAGFHAAAEAAGLKRCAHVLDGGPLNECGHSVIAEVGRVTARQIAMLRAPPTGVVALNDLMAPGLMAGLRDAACEFRTMSRWSTSTACASPRFRTRC